MIDLEDLKRKARAAHVAAPEEWKTMSYEGKSETGRHQYSVCSEANPFDKSHCCVATLLVADDGDTRLPDFVAAANPSTILELIRQLEAAHAHIRGLESEARQ